MLSARCMVQQNVVGFHWVFDFITSNQQTISKNLSLIAFNLFPGLIMVWYRFQDTQAKGKGGGVGQHRRCVEWTPPFIARVPPTHRCAWTIPETFTDISKHFNSAQECLHECISKQIVLSFRYFKFTCSGSSYRWPNPMHKIWYLVNSVEAHFKVDLNLVVIMTFNFVVNSSSSNGSTTNRIQLSSAQFSSARILSGFHVFP